MNREISADGQDDVLSGQDNPTTWVSHPIDIRISIPFLHTRFYITLVAGRERRRAERRREERRDYPLLTIGNALFALGVTTLIALVGLGVLIAMSSIIEF